MATVGAMGKTEGADHPRGLASYAALGGALLAFFLVLRGSSWQGSKDLHTLMETAATLLAAIVGILALVRFHTQRNNTILLLGTGFLGTAFLDGYHAIVTSHWFDQVWPSPPPHLIPWSWNASRLFLAGMMFLSWWFWRREKAEGEQARLSEWNVYGLSAGLTLLCFVFFSFVPLPRAYYPELPMGRPEELVSAALFLAALVGYLQKGSWRTDHLEHWIVISLIVGFMSQVAFMPFSFGLFDAMLDSAHLLKTTTYACVLVGLLHSVVAVFQQVNASARAARDAELALATKVEDLALANQELEAFAHIASHDLKEPLRGIHNYAHLLLEDYGERFDENGLRMLSTLPRLSQRLDGMLDALLRYVGSGQKAPCFSRVPLQELALSEIELLRDSIESRGVEIRMPEELPTLECDRDVAGSVYRELLGNALKYNDKPNRWIELGVRPASDFADLQDDSSFPVLYVRDNGIGIRSKHLRSVFRIFKRLHVRDRYGSGSGAGLTIIERLLTRCGGRIWAESTLGEGTTFYFTLRKNPDA